MLADIGGQQLPGGLQVPKVGEKAALLRVGKGIYGEMGRAVQGEGEVILPSDSLILAEGDQMAAMTRNLVSWEGRWFMITSVESP